MATLERDQCPRISAWLCVKRWFTQTPGVLGSLPLILSFANQQEWDAWGAGRAPT